MKAKSKVLLGLIVALAMMVFAVPAFAAMHTVTAPTPDEQEVFVGDEASFKFTINRTDGADTDAYEVAFTDTTDATPFTVVNEDITTTPDPIKGKNIEVTVKVETDRVGNGVDFVGEHSLAYSVTGPAGTVAGSGQVAKITVKELPTAELTGATNGKKVLDAGDAIDLNVVNVKPTTATTKTYQWQISDTKEEADDPDSEDWENISGATKTTLSDKATADMNGKFVRCLVTVDGKTVVASDKKDDPNYCVELTVADPENVTVKTVNKDATYFAGATTAEALEVTATGGSGDYEYQWTKDGKDIEGAEDEEYAFPADGITADDAGKYNCVVTDGEGVKGKLDKDIVITVNPTPTLKIAEATGDASKYTNPAEAPTEEKGVIQVKAEDMEKALTLTAEATELTPTAYRWYKNVDTEIPTATGSSYTIKANELNVTDTYTVKAYFEQEGLTDPITYEVSFKEISGSLDGDLLTSADGTFAGATKNPTYTITLPEGTVFKKAVAEEDVTTANLKTEYGVDIKNVVPGAKFNVTVDNENEPATMTLMHTAFTNQTAPYVKDLEVTVEALDALVPTDTVDVNLPVVEGVGYNITVGAQGYSTQVSELNRHQIVLKGMEKTTTEEAVKHTYDGKAVEAEVVAAEGVEGLGDIDNICFVQTAGNNFPNEQDIKKATTEAPVDVGRYYVICNIKDGEKWGGADDQVAGLIIIDPVDYDLVPEDEISNYFVIDPESVVYNGENQKPEVDFAQGLEKVGKIQNVSFYDEKGVLVDPLNVGVYTVKVDVMKRDSDTNLVENGSEIDLEVGTFEITKVEPTKDLYEMKPTEVTYTGAEQEPAIAKADDKAGDVDKVHYFKEGSPEELKTKPTEAGVYAVTIDTKESDTYAAKEGLSLGTFTIKPDAGEQPILYMNAHVQDQGWDKENTELNPGEAVDVGTTGLSRRVEAVAIMVPEDYKVVGFAHVQNVGDADITPVESSKDYDIPEGYKAYEFGSTGKSQRVEAVCIGIQDAAGEYVKGFQYAVHLQNYGWQGYVRNGSFSGTRGMALRMESIRFTYADPDVVKPGEPSGSLLK